MWTNTQTINEETMTYTTTGSGGLQWETPFEVSWDDVAEPIRFNRENMGDLPWSPVQDDTESIRKDIAILYERVIKMSVEMAELKLIKVRFEELNARLKAAMEQCTTISEEDIADILGFGL